jgi:hypothetical protein
MAERVEIRHTPPLRGGFAQLAKKGTIRFTSYNTTRERIKMEGIILLHFGKDINKIDTNCF